MRIEIPEISALVTLEVDHVGDFRLMMIMHR